MKKVEKRLAIKLKLYYFDDCPSYERARENLKDALHSEGLAQEVEMVPVASEADAQAKSFIGSPTIRIDGIDIEGPEAEEKGYGYGCRVYSGNGCMSGWPSVEQIRQALAAFQTGKVSRSLSTTEEAANDKPEPQCDCH